MAMYYRARQLTADVRDCQRCDAAAQVTHHRDENPRNNTPTNLERLCRPCHVAHHRAQVLDAKRRAWNPHRHGTPAERRRANGTLRQAVHDGRITKPRHCSRCGAGGRIDGHHADYHRALDVEWLCRPCHAVAHRVAPIAVAR
jgi:hypothetical protein